MKIEVGGMLPLNLNITQNDLSYSIMKVVLRELGNIDDAGCSWLTDGDDTYIGDQEWKVSSDSNIARLVDAANILRYGEPMHIEFHDEEV